MEIRSFIRSPQFILEYISHFQWNRVLL